MSDVTLASVDADVLSCWESKVKLGLECSLILKHSKGKITTTLQFSKRRDLDSSGIIDDVVVVLVECSMVPAEEDVSHGEIVSGSDLEQ